ITGTNLLGTSSVTFNGIPVACSALTLDSPTQITVTVPPGANTGRIVVTTPGGTATSSTNFTVDGPVITSILPGSATVGSTITSLSSTSGQVGSTVFIFGTNLLDNGTPTVTFDGVRAQLVPDDLLTGAVNSDTELIVTVPAGATTGRICVTTPGGVATSAGD